MKVIVLLSDLLKHLRWPIGAMGIGRSQSHVAQLKILLHFVVVRASTLQSKDVDSISLSS